MDTSFHFAAIYQKVEVAKSTNATLVCDSISSILRILDMLGIDDDSVIAPLETAYDIADVSLGLGEELLNRMLANQITHLLEDFSSKLKAHG